MIKIIGNIIFTVAVIAIIIGGAALDSPDPIWPCRLIFGGLVVGFIGYHMTKEKE